MRSKGRSGIGKGVSTDQRPIAAASLESPISTPVCRSEYWCTMRALAIRDNRSTRRQARRRSYLHHSKRGSGSLLIFSSDLQLYRLLLGICAEMSALTTGVKITTVQIGNAFERRSLSLLRDTFHMDLIRVGGKGDGGIDLRGYWNLPGLVHLSQSRTESSDPVKLRVLAQCKAERLKLGPRAVREMEGVVSALMVNEPYGYPSLGVIISQSGFSKAALDRAAASAVPLAMVDLPALAVSSIPEEALSQLSTEGIDGKDDPNDIDHFEVNGAWWNQSLAKLLNHEFELRRVHQEVGEGAERRMIQRAVLWRNGRSFKRVESKGHATL